MGERKGKHRNKIRELKIMRLSLWEQQIAFHQSIKKYTEDTLLDLEIANSFSLNRN